MKRKLLNLCLTALLSVVSTTAWALVEEGGFYQIGSPADYAEFAALVNGGQARLNAILTADIDLGTDIDTYKIYNGEYQGVFDGSGHTITIDFADGTKDNQGPALFRSIGRFAIVKRLKVQGTLTTARQHAAGIANYSGGIIRDCWADLNIICSQQMADASAAAIIGQCNMHSVTENCLAKVAIDAPDSHKFGGVAAWSDAQRTHFANNLVLNDNANFDWSDGKSAGIVRNDANLAIVDLQTYNADSYHNRPQSAVANNYVLDDWGALNKGTAIVSSEDVASGKVCYQLNSDQSDIRWTQNIGTDPYPVPAVFRTAGQVYASAATNCQGIAEGEVTYSNEGSVTATPHTYDKYGICTTCGQFNWNYFDLNDPEKFDLLDRSFVINDGADFFVIETWNRFHNGLKFNMKLARDVECKSEPGQLIFNNNGWLESSFYGQNHTLTIEMVDITEDWAALFPKWYNTNGGAVIENLILHGTIGTSARQAGSVIGRDYGSDNKVRNVFSDVTINTTHTGDCSHGGFMNCGGTRTTFDNCIYAGDINGVEGSEAVAGFCGWANGTNYFNNCAFIGTLNNFSGDTHTLSRNVGSARFSNVYSTYDYNGTDADKYTAVAAEAVASGELAFRLNEEQEGFDRFYQLIGTDPEPMPIKKEGALVYTQADNYGCDGKPIGNVSYANTPSAIVPAHQFEEGLCTVCGELDENFMTPVDGWYEVGTPAQLMWWAHWAAKKDLGASVRLTADIDMADYNESYPDRQYPQVGNETTPFYGNFDGQYHTISNLNIYLPGKRGAGLIGVMSSQPSSGFGGLSAEQARAAEGVFVKNVVLDNTCSIYGQGYTGVVGMAANWPGHITISGVLNLGDATVDGGTNGAGLFGCAMGSASHMTITGCGYIGTIHVLNDTHTENGLFSGWLGQYVEVTNCFAMGTIDAYPDPARSWARHPNYNTIVIKNCYGLEGSGVIENDYNGNPEVTFVPAEEIASGALAWKANAGQLRNPDWYQTLGNDDNPTPFPTHGTVIYGAEQYFSAQTDADIEGIAPVVEVYEVEKAGEDIIATQALLDEWKTVAEALGEVTTILGYADAVDSLEAIKAAVQENAAIYQAYINKCVEVKTFLENDQTFSGNLRTALEAYLSDEEAEPDEDNPLGSYAYIVENHTATGEEIQAETERVDEWLKKAIAEDYVPGTDISWLIPNSDFAKKNTEHWSGAWCNAYGTVLDGNGKEVVGVEAWNRTGNMYQTVENMKPGYYLVGVSGAFRPSNNRYSKNHAAGIYANGIFNYFPTVIEDYIAVNDTIDQVNCNLHGLGALDLAIYDDYFSTSEEQAADNAATLLGFAVHGPYGMAAAANAGRHQAYTIAYVGEDGKLTIGIKSQGTKYSNDWTGWGPIKVSYCGDDAELAGKALDEVLGNMTARAQTIIAYEIDEDVDNPAASPNFPAELRDSLQEVIDAIAGAETVEAKVALAERFSSLFQKVYDGKRAYIDLFNFASTLDYIEEGNLPLVAKDAEGLWYETGDMVFSNDEAEAIFDAGTAMLSAFSSGAYSTEEALNPVTALEGAQAEAVATIVPEKDKDGYYLVSNPKQFVAYRALVNGKDNTLKGKLVNDVDMAGIGMQPFTPSKVYSGTFDGQGHALENVTISHYGDMHTALFFELQNATVKNLKLTGEYYSDQQRMAGLAAWTSGTTMIENCEIAVALYSEKEGDGTHGGVMAVHGRGGNCTVNNCLVACQFIGENTFSVGGVCGWRDATLNVKNTLILSQYELADEPATYATAIVSRNGFTNGGNVFYSKEADRVGGIDQGTLATDEQLASGEICYKLNGDQTTINWWQTLGEDAHPELFGNSLRVWFNEKEGIYTNEEPVDNNGDLNGDGKIDIADAVTVLKAMAENPEDQTYDVNGDGKVDIADFVTILKLMAE